MRSAGVPSSQGEFCVRDKHYPASVLGTRVLLTTDRVSQWGRVKIFRKKGTPAIKWLYFGNEKDIVMVQRQKWFSRLGQQTTRWRKFGYQTKKSGFRPKCARWGRFLAGADFGRRHVTTEQSANNEKSRFLQKNKGESEKPGFNSTKKNIFGQFSENFGHFFLKIGHLSVNSCLSPIIFNHS